MSELPYFSDPWALQHHLQTIRQLRKSNKVKKARSYQLNKEARLFILQKTDGHCHICGITLEAEKFEADHVKSHSKDGENILDNFLPACKHCNNYRWDYLPEEMQWILKLGVWARTEIEKGTKFGEMMAESFLKHDVAREKRRVNPRG